MPAWNRSLPLGLHVFSIHCLAGHTSSSSAEVVNSSEHATVSPVPVTADHRHCHAGQQDRRRRLLPVRLERPHQRHVPICRVSMPASRLSSCAVFDASADTATACIFCSLWTDLRTAQLTKSCICSADPVSLPTEPARCLVREPALPGVIPVPR